MFKVGDKVLYTQKGDKGLRVYTCIVEIAGVASDCFIRVVDDIGVAFPVFKSDLLPLTDMTRDLYL